MAISLTESAADRVRSYIDKRGAAVGLRLGVTKTGCSGYSYVLNYAEEVRDDDVVFEDKGVQIVVGVTDTIQPVRQVLFPHHGDHAVGQNISGPIHVSTLHLGP